MKGCWQLPTACKLRRSPAWEAVAGPAAVVACPLENLLLSSPRPLQGEVARLSGKIAELDAEIDSLRDSVSHLGESLANAMSDGSAAGAEEADAGGRAWGMGGGTGLK